MICDTFPKAAPVGPRLCSTFLYSSTRFELDQLEEVNELDPHGPIDARLVVETRVTP